MGPAPAVAEVRSAVRAALRDAQRAHPGPVVVACSGGADSLALAAATAYEAGAAGVRAGLLTVDHGLSDGSAEQAAAVARIGADLGLDPVRVMRVEVGHEGGPEAAARAARYAALDAAAAELDAWILLGHTLDDQAETVLLGLGRGSGPRSVVGMAVREGRYLRPLLRLRRATTVAACAALGRTPWTDPANADPAHTRVRLRVEALPLLEDVLQGGVAPALARTADLLRDDLAALDEWAAAALDAATLTSPAHLSVPGRAIARPGTDNSAVEGEKADGRLGVSDESGLDVATLERLPRAIRTRVLRAWAARQGAEPLSAERTAALDALVVDWHGQGPVDLPGAVAVCRRSGTLVAVPGTRRTPRRGT